MIEIDPMMGMGCQWERERLKSVGALALALWSRKVGDFFFDLIWAFARVSNALLERERGFQEGKREESTWEEEEAAALKASTHINKSKDGLYDSIENISAFVLL